MDINFQITQQQQQELYSQEISPSEIEENIVFRQRQQQRTQLLSKIEESIDNANEKDQDELIKLKGYVLGLYTFFENEWKGFSQEGDLEIGNCYKFCINKLNIFKNILRSFFSYMKNKGDDIVIECLDSFQKPIQKVKKQFIRFSERHPANNKSMQVLFEYDRYGRQFEYFLNFYAVDWLIKSKVKDVIPHLLSIFFLLRCFQTPQLKDQLKVYKKTKKITLPRKVRKSNLCAQKNKNDQENIKCEEVTSMQIIDSFIPSSTDSFIPSSTDSFNGSEENKSIGYSNQEYQSVFSSSYQDNFLFTSYPQKQSSFDENQNQTQDYQNVSFCQQFGRQNSEPEIFDGYLGCEQFQTRNAEKLEYYENQQFKYE